MEWPIWRSKNLILLIGLANGKSRICHLNEEKNHFEVRALREMSSARTHEQCIHRLICRHSSITGASVVRHQRLRVYCWRERKSEAAREREREEERQSSSRVCTQPSLIRHCCRHSHVKCKIIVLKCDYILSIQMIICKTIQASCFIKHPFWVYVLSGSDGVTDWLNFYDINLALPKMSHQNGLNWEIESAKRKKNNGNTF